MRDPGNWRHATTYPPVPSQAIPACADRAKSASLAWLTVVVTVPSPEPDLNPHGPDLQKHAVHYSRGWKSAGQTLTIMCPRGDLNTETGEISPDRGNHAITVTGRGGHTRVFRGVFAIWSATWPVRGCAAGLVIGACGACCSAPRAPRTLRPRTTRPAETARYILDQPTPEQGSRHSVKANQWCPGQVDRFRRYRGKCSRFLR